MSSPCSFEPIRERWATVSIEDVKAWESKGDEVGRQQTFLFLAILVLAIST